MTCHGQMIPMGGFASHPMVCQLCKKPIVTGQRYVRLAMKIRGEDRRIYICADCNVNDGKNELTK